MSALWIPRDGSLPTLAASPDADVIAPDDEIDGVALRDLLARGGETPAQRAVVEAYRAAEEAAEAAELLLRREQQPIWERFPFEGGGATEPEVGYVVTMTSSSEPIR